MNTLQCKDLLYSHLDFVLMISYIGTVSICRSTEATPPFGRKEYCASTGVGVQKKKT